MFQDEHFLLHFNFSELSEVERLARGWVCVFSQGRRCVNQLCVYLRLCIVCSYQKLHLS